MGKADWLAAGWPVERGEPAEPTLGQLAEPDDDGRVVLNAERVVLGLRGHDGVAEGPSTYRADVTVAEMTAKLREDPTEWIVVTTPEGVLVGLVNAGVMLG